MSEDKKKTVADGSNPWSQPDPNWPKESGDPMVGPDTPTERPAQSTPFRQVYPQSRPTPTNNQQAAASGDSQTLMMHASQGTVPLAWLAVVEGAGAPRGTIYALQREMVVGRMSGDIILRDPAVSGQHLKIRLEPSEQDVNVGRFVLYDMASANGTFVGDYEACKNELNRVYRHILRDGDYILIGKTILVFKQV